MESNYYLINKGVVVNFVVSTPDVVQNVLGPLYDEIIDIATLTAPYPDIGWSYIMGIFTPPEKKD